MISVDVIATAGGAAAAALAAVPAVAAAMLERRTLLDVGARSPAADPAVLRRCLFVYGAPYRAGGVALTALAALALHSIAKHRTCRSRHHKGSSCGGAAASATSTLRAVVVDVVKLFAGATCLITAQLARVPTLMHALGSFGDVQSKRSMLPADVVRSILFSARTQWRYQTLEDKIDHGPRRPQLPRSTVKLVAWHIFVRGNLQSALAIAAGGILISHPALVEGVWKGLVGSDAGGDESEVVGDESSTASASENGDARLRYRHRRRRRVQLTGLACAALLLFHAGFHTLQRRVDASLQLAAHYSPVAAEIGATQQPPSPFGLGTIGGAVLTAAAEALPVVAAILLRSGFAAL